MSLTDFIQATWLSTWFNMLVLAFGIIAFGWIIIDLEKALRNRHKVYKVKR